MPSPSASPAARLSRPRMHNPVVATVLVVDDDPIVLDVVVRYLERDGFRTLTAADGEAARAVLERESPSLVVLDVMLPGMDGLSLCRWIRATSDLPVILLTARGEEADRIVGLELGADDYVTKPFSPRGLAPRLGTVLLRRLSAPPRAEQLTIGELALNAATREAHRDAELLKLTAKEFALPCFLASNPNPVFSRAHRRDPAWAS